MTGRASAESVSLSLTSLDCSPGKEHGFTSFFSSALMGIGVPTKLGQYERIIGNKLEVLKFIWVDLLNEHIPLLKSPEVKLILNKCISKLAELQSVRNSIARGKRKAKKISFQH